MWQKCAGAKSNPTTWGMRFAGAPVDDKPKSSGDQHQLGIGRFRGLGILHLAMGLKRTWDAVRSTCPCTPTTLGSWISGVTDLVSGSWMISNWHCYYQKDKPVPCTPSQHLPVSTLDNR